MAIDTTDSKIELITDDYLLDDIEDLPAFVTFPTGVYLVHLPEGIEAKDVKIQEEDTKCFECKMDLKEVLDLPATSLNEGEVAPKPGDQASVLWPRNNRFAMGNFKDFTKPIAAHSGAKTVGEVVAASKGLDLMIVVKRTASKKDPDRFNMNFKKVDVV